VSPKKSGAGHSKGCCRAKVLERRKASRIASDRLPVHAGGTTSVLGDFRQVSCPREWQRTTGVATEVSEVRLTVLHLGRRTPKSGDRVARRSESLCRESRRYPRVALGAQPSRLNREPTRHECSYEEREKAEVGPTHRASRRSGDRKLLRTIATLAR